MNPCACAEHAETFTELVTSAAHWELELFIMLVFDGLVLGLAWPFLKRHFQHHLIHDKAHQETTPTPGKHSQSRPGTESGGPDGGGVGFTIKGPVRRT